MKDKFVSSNIERFVEKEYVAVIPSTKYLLSLKIRLYFKLTLKTFSQKAII